MTAVDHTGRTYSRLTVIERAPNRGRLVAWTCRCECGTQTTVTAANLVARKTRSCGCLRHELNVERGKSKGAANGRASSTTHGLTDSPTFLSWKSMRQRCTYPSDIGWLYYGGRGITVCESWMTFANFLEDMGERPEGMTLDRIDSDGHYEPGNVRWATPTEQAHNRR